MLQMACFLKYIPLLKGVSFSVAFFIGSFYFFWEAYFGPHLLRWVLLFPFLLFFGMYSLGLVIDGLFKIPDGSQETLCEQGKLGREVLHSPNGERWNMPEIKNSSGSGGGEETTMIFVFGSNEAGIHGAGAARYARNYKGAIIGQGYGLQGNSFAIPTCSLPTGKPNHEIPLSKVKEYVGNFLDYARLHLFDEEFQITQIGCGLAGFEAEEIAPLFEDAPLNCLFDEAWREYLPFKRFWGTF